MANGLKIIGQGQIWMTTLKRLYAKYYWLYNIRTNTY